MSLHSNASTSLKNPLLVRVWPMCLSVKPLLRRLLFMQYKIMPLVRINLCRLVGIRLNRWGLVLTSEWILSAKPYLLWRVFIIYLVNFAKPAWCSNSGKLVRSRVNIQVYLSGLCRKVLLIALDAIPDVCSSCFYVLLTCPAADPTIRRRANEQFPPTYSKTCSVVSSVEYINWMWPCLLST